VGQAQTEVAEKVREEVLPQRVEQPAAAVPPDQVAALQRMARWWAYERLYRVIFRSQIELLRFLEARPGQRARWTELIQFYQNALTRGLLPARTPYENFAPPQNVYGPPSKVQRATATRRRQAA
jgi:hypothetical protein